jgi:uncharacterized protein (TIGR01319 family)
VSAALLIDFGSTYTKLRAVDLEAADIIGSGQGPSTVDTDVTVGMQAALDDLESRMGALPDFTHRLASSSAAGGLAMVTVGLVKEMTAEAARLAALGAGAKLTGAFAYNLTAADIDAIAGLNPDILLLAGGTDGGNFEVILHNATALAGCAIDCPVVVAGNRAVADQVAEILTDGGKTVTITGNVMPDFNILDIEPARDEIRRIFIDRIIHAKGIDRASAMFDEVLLPTPAAVMEGAQLIADGTDDRDGLGPLLVVDVGGAPTDVHSVAEGLPSDERVIQHGLPEPYVKRTVEGDLGMRYNAHAILEAVGADLLADDAGLDAERVTTWVEAISVDIDRLPADDAERAVDRALARAAVRLAVKRHAGVVETVFTANGPVGAQKGKDLTTVGTVIGTGGALVHGADPAAILDTARFDDADPMSLRPRRPTLYIDQDYALYACGLLAQVMPDVALTLGMTRLHAVATEETDGHSTAA